MKTIFAIVLVASVVGWIRFDRWSSLKDEAARLESVSLPPSGGRSNESSRGNYERVLSYDIPELLGPELLQLVALNRFAYPDECKQIQRSIVNQLDGLDPQSISNWIATLEADASVPVALKAKVAPACVQALLEVDPEAAMRLIGLLPEGEVGAGLAVTAFNNWAARRPGEALRWYEEMEASGWPMARDSSLLLAVSVEQSRIDPGRVLARALSLEGTGVGGTLTILGDHIGSQLRTVDENRSVLVALERASKKAPESKLLAGIRQGYIEQLASSLPEWPIDDAISLVETGFRADEKLMAVRQASNCLSREETERWADWAAEAQAPVTPQHPLMSLIIGWTLFDPEAAGRWLAREPAGSLREMAMEVYLSRLESMDSATAISCLDVLPDSPRKTALLKSARQRMEGE